MKAGDLIIRIELQAETTTTDEFGGEVNPDQDAEDITGEWTTFATRWAGVKTTGGGELVEAQQTQSEQTHTFTLRYLAGVTSEARIKWGSRIFNIANVENVDEENLWLVITTKERNG